MTLSVQEQLVVIHLEKMRLDLADELLHANSSNPEMIAKAKVFECMGNIIRDMKEGILK